MKNSSSHGPRKERGMIYAFLELMLCYDSNVVACIAILKDEWEKYFYIDFH